MDESFESPSVRRELAFDRGTLVLSGASPTETPASSKFWKWREETSQWHTDAYRYQTLRWDNPEILDRVPGWNSLLLSTHLPELRDYQRKAKADWSVKKSGLIVLPTGTGKTAVGLSIMADLAISSLVVCPTRDLMYQWANRIEECLGQRPGIIGDSHYELCDLCVTTYHSACIRMAEFGSRFGLIVFDECHHLPGRVRADAARMSSAPYRLGLTATPPVEAQLTTIHDLIGPVVYSMGVKQARGTTLATYTTVRTKIRLNKDEEEAYAAAGDVIRSFMAAQKRDNPNFHWEDIYGELAADTSARKALAAQRKRASIEDRAEQKLDILEDIFRNHPGMPTIIFTGSNVMARAVSRRFLIPYILSENGRDERCAILAGIEAGTYRALVANEVLDEGVDLPCAKVAVVLGGKTSSRQAVQRLGRILRKDGDIPATLYEVVCEDTKEVAQSKKRNTNDAYEGTLNLRF
jgi:superfamily II DNA or RNA helicase